MTSTSALDRIDDAARSILFTDARTSNSFAPTPVSDEELESIWDLAKWPPTAANTQPLRVLYVRTDEGRDRLLTHMAEGNVEKTRSAPAVAILAVDTEFYEHIPTLLPFKPELKDVLAQNDSMSETMRTFNSALQAGYFIMAVRAVGLAAGPMAGFDNAGIDAEFFPDGRWKSILVVNIGHPGTNPWFDRLPRLNHDSVVAWA
jgi:3-hydroxypropanoate dehydrogenase